jgi:TfoX/Sxy family transcriptional regulator of competence genes
MAGTIRKSPPELVDSFEALLTSLPGAEPRKMFGMPCAFVNGNMFIGLFEDRIMFRLGAADRERALAEGAVPFEAMGRSMKEYVTLPPNLQSDPSRVNSLAGHALKYASGLPPKQPKSPKTKRTKV